MVVGLGKDVKVFEIEAKTVLNRSKVYDYTVNPYFGCSHGCIYCYVRMMRRFMGVREKWGKFVLVKVNAPEILKREVRKKKKGTSWVSGMCDPYQPIEREMRITRRCLEILLEEGMKVVIQTKSHIILDDIDLISSYKDLEVIITISTGDELIRKLFEPKAPPVEMRLHTLKMLSEKGIRCSLMIAPMLPQCEKVLDLAKDFVEKVYLDRMNYGFANWVYERYGLSWANTPKFFREKATHIAERLKGSHIRCHILF